MYTCVYNSLQYLSEVDVTITVICKFQRSSMRFGNLAMVTMVTQESI